MPEAEREPTDLPAGQSDQGEQLGFLLDASQKMIAEEFLRSERLEAKSRNQFTVTGALFAVVMATTAGILNVQQANHQELQSWVLPVVGAWAILAIVTAGVALTLSRRVWKTRESDALSAETIRKYVPFAE